MTIEELKLFKESENRVEFKEAKSGNYSFNGGNKPDPKDRRKCIIGYVVAFLNEGGGYLVFGMHDTVPHVVVGTTLCKNSIGKLEADIYREKQVRVQITELYEDDKRVLVIKIPGRPAGKVYKFEDVPLMRVGEELLPMSDTHYLNILQEQEPDFSSEICHGLLIEDLDGLAVSNMKEAYAEKQSNPLFLTQSVMQCLTDLNLMTQEGKLSYGSLILLGTESAIQKYLPQAAIFLEYRNDIGQITFDHRDQFRKAYFSTIEKIWSAINTRNGKVPVQQGLYIFDIPFFNKEVIREALNNAVAHRDYRRSSEVVIKQYPQSMSILSPGGFPIGVTLKNLITVSSTPRNRLLAEVLAKTGIVERSGQGVDKIFFQSLAEAKGMPDYSRTDDFQVELRLSAIVKDKAFALFIKQLQKDRAVKLSVKEIVTLDAIREGRPKASLEKNIIEKLLSEGLVDKVGKTSNQRIILSKSYYAFTNKEADYLDIAPPDESLILMRIEHYLKTWGHAKIGKFVELFDSLLTRDQVKTFIYKLVESNYLGYTGIGSGRQYFLKNDVTSQTERIVTELIKQFKLSILNQHNLNEKESLINKISTSNPEDFT